MTRAYTSHSRRRLALLASLLLLLFILPGCDECRDFTAPSYEFSFKIVDGEFKELVGPDYPYDPESIFLLVNGNNVITERVYNPVSRTYRFVVNLAGFDIFNDDPYLLMIASADTDTLRLTVDRTEGDCVDQFNLSQLLYNGVEIDIDQDPVILVKEN